MDPVAAFALAETVFQFVEHGTDFVGLAWRLYQKRTSDAHASNHLQRINEDLVEILPRLSVSEDGSVSVGSFNQLANECRETAGKLLQILQTLKLDEEHRRRRDIVRTAFQIKLKEDTIRQLEKKIEALRSQLILNLLVSIR